MTNQDQAQPEKNVENENNQRTRPGGNESKGSVLSDTIDPRQYFAVVLQYWWLILLIALLGAAAATAYSVTATPLYRATCRYEVLRDTRLQITEQDQKGWGSDSMEEEINRQMVILRSGALHQRVMERLQAKWSNSLKKGELRPQISVDRVRQSNTMLDIQVDSVKAEYSEKYLQGMLDAHDAMRQIEINNTTDRAVESLKNELNDVSSRLKGAEDDLTEFRSEHNLTYTQTRTWYDERFLANLVQRENSLRMEKIMLESQYDFLQDADVATIQDAIRLTQESKRAAGNLTNISESEFANITEGGGESMNPAVAAANDSDNAGLERLQWGESMDWQEVQARLERLEAEYEDQLSIYKPDHPEMVELKRQIESAERDLRLASEIALKRLSARFSAIDIQLEAVNDASKAWRKQLDLSSGERAEHAALQAKVEHLKNLHDRVYTRILDGSVVNVDALYNRVIEGVKSFDEPVWPATVRIMVLSIIASLGLGVGLAFMFDHFDTRFLDALAIEERLNVPYISGTPDWNRVIRGFNPNESGLLVSRDESDVCTETYRAMRAGLEYMINDQDSYVLMVTSGEDGEGKTMTALNLASLFAWSGRKILLVDGDLRRGSCHNAFGAKRRPGLCEFFMGQEADWRNLIQKTGEENFDFIASGHYQNAVPEMLSGARLHNLMNEWRQEYDLIIMDSAPAGRVVDTTFFGKAADGTLLIARHGKASFGSVRHTLHRLLGTNIVGFCLNGIQLGKRKYSYYNRYGRYYYGRYSHPYGQYYGSSDDHAEVEEEAKTAES